MRQSIPLIRIVKLRELIEHLFSQERLLIPAFGWNDFADEGNPHSLIVNRTGAFKRSIDELAPLSMGTIGERQKTFDRRLGNPSNWQLIKKHPQRLDFLF